MKTLFFLAPAINAMRQHPVADLSHSFLSGAEIFLLLPNDVCEEEKPFSKQYLPYPGLTR